MENIERKVFVTFEVEGFHAWENAPATVAFLRTTHRHLFKYRVEVEVFHNDRDIEFILLKRELSAFCEGNAVGKSCEMLAEELIEYIVNNYPNRKVSVEVSEDGENGAVLSLKAGGSNG